MNEYIPKPVNEELFMLISKFGFKEKNSQEEKKKNLHPIIITLTLLICKQ
jgi:hypothetical protein